MNPRTAPKRAPRTSFAQLVRAETLLASWRWSSRDSFALATIPLIFLAGWGAASVTSDPASVAVIDTCLRLILLVILVVAYRPLLVRHWRAFRNAPIRGILLVIAGMVLTQVIISAVAAFIPDRASAAATEVTGLDPVTADAAQMMLIIFLTLGPIATAFIEDTVFRHTLLIKLPLWSRPALALLVLLINAIIFGAIHFFNFGSLMGTVPYMAAGLFFNLIYLWTRNIWHVLLMHTLNNAVLTLGGVILIAVVRPDL